jgi:hypothetical protein
VSVSHLLIRKAGANQPSFDVLGHRVTLCGSLRPITSIPWCPTSQAHAHAGAGERSWTEWPAHDQYNILMSASKKNININSEINPKQSSRFRIFIPILFPTCQAFHKMTSPESHHDARCANLWEVVANHHMATHRSLEGYGSTTALLQF